MFYCPDNAIRAWKIAVMDPKLKEIKRSIARCQLGTALDLFLADRDPVSVHVLASGACELLDGLAEVEGTDRFMTHILESFPDCNVAELRRIQRKYYNAFKHLLERGKAAARNDVDVINAFNDNVNDHALFIGWHDYMSLAHSLPVEAQVFQAWYFTVYQEKAAPNTDLEPFLREFSGVNALPRADQKEMLRKRIKLWCQDEHLLRDSRTEPRSDGSPHFG
jgi:hypothetical protein